MGLFLGDSEPSKIFVGDTPISKVFLGDTQIRPSYTPRAPDSSRTLLYLQLNNNTTDSSGNSVSVSSSGIIYGTIGNNHYAETTSTQSYIRPTATIGQQIGTGDFTVSSFFYAVDTTHQEGAWIFGDWYDNGYPRPGVCIRFDYSTDSSTNYGISWINDGVGAGQIKADCSINARHHQVYVRRNGTVYGFLDGVKYGPETNTLNFASPGVNKFFVLNRNDYSPQRWGQSGAKTSEVIFEKVAWTDEEIAGYFNYQKANYGIS